MANHGKYYIAVRLLLLKQYHEANAGRSLPGSFREEAEAFTKLSFLNITIPLSFNLTKYNITLNITETRGITCTILLLVFSTLFQSFMI